MEPKWLIKNMNIDHVEMVGLSSFINKGVKVDDLKRTISFHLQVPMISGSADVSLASQYFVFPMSCCDAPVMSCEQRLRPCNSTITIEGMGVDVDVDYEIVQSLENNKPAATLVLKDINMKILPGDSTEWIDVSYLNGAMGKDALNGYQKRILSKMNKFLLHKVSYDFLEYLNVASSNTSCLEAHAGFFGLLVYCDLVQILDM